LIIPRHAKIENKEINDDQSGYFYLKEYRVTKVVEWIAMNFGLLILHKAKVIIL